MKTNPILAALLSLMLIASGCGIIPGTKIKAGSDPLVVNAEQLAKEATATLDDFITYVDRNRVVMGKDAIAARDLAATSGPVYIRELRKATKAYKASRTGEDGSTVQAKLDALRGLLETIRAYYAPNPKNV